ncbi:IlvD/Edd family dehydratase [Phytoactinopolyspora mesophila]|uniref:Dihydroxy-acid dehydratase n=1 Tax=Phytoactinopolyspora mesophila TaxID=2650750 RepID=A0A7K3M1E2_9ACTN|nr:IlvD/Edd family dehydratase [Phytoactinopolyspora mesophila]NDL57113.1 dihydroxy-acid dehydratase [Phytoactinopolyspora mesophila]
MGTTKNTELRSTGWFGQEGKLGFIHRSWLKNQGTPHEMFDGRPVIGIANSWSDLTPCNAHLRRVAEHVKRGVYRAGGYPLEFPTMSLGETIMRPSTMLFRNLMSMDVEETLRANPIDGVVLLAGCDKTTPAQLMGAASVDLPTIMVTGGPMLSGRWQGKAIGSGTDVWRFSEEVRAGKMSGTDFTAAEACMSRSQGHCMTMGTASTMACITEALGLAPSGSAAIPATDARRFTVAEHAGQQIVDLVRDDLRFSQIATRAAFENAIRANAAIGGSTNAVLHLLALAGRLEVPLELEDFDRLARDVPTLVNLMPSGQYLMEDFYYAGGLPAVMRQIDHLLNQDVITVDQHSLAENLARAEHWNADVIRPATDPLLPAGTGTAVLRGNLCPSGAVVKQSAASPDLMRHRGRALVFDSIEEYDEAVDDPSLEVDASTVLVVRYAGPSGYPGMPEIGNLALPRKLLEQGVTDMVRISDARMSGTSYGTVILHAAPEAAVGGPISLVRTGDWIELDVPARTLTLDVDEAELDRRRAAWSPPRPAAERGYVRMYIDHVQQADRGCDLDFLLGGSGAPVPRRPF